MIDPYSQIYRERIRLNLKRNSNGKKQKHTKRNIILSVITIVLVAWGGYLLGTYNSLKNEDSKNESTLAEKSSTSTQSFSQKNSESDSFSRQKATTSQEKQESSSSKRYSQSEMTTANQQFLDWAIAQAKRGNMAVTDNYFTHGASGTGDWYAETVDGKALVQLQAPDNPGYNAYQIHALGGVSFYTSKNGTIGYDNVPSKAVTAEGLSKAADKKHQIHKYLLCDNGVVYEAISSYENLVAFSSPFGLYDDDGKTTAIPAKITFKVSQDQAAQNEWKKILSSL